jgi:hypothetical protein
MIRVWCKQLNDTSVVQTVKRYECGANSEMIWVWRKQLNDTSVVQTMKWYECGANSKTIWVWRKQYNTMSVVQTVKWYECDANSEMIWVWCKQLNDTSVVQTVMQCCTWVPIIRVGQNYTFIGIYGVHTVFLAGKSPYIRSYTVQIYDSGQPYSWYVTDCDFATDRNWNERSWTATVILLC